MATVSDRDAVDDEVAYDPSILAMKVLITDLTAAIGREFEDSGRTYGSPRIGLELREKGWRVSDNTIAARMTENGWVARKVKRRHSTTRQGKRHAAPDLVHRQFTAIAQDVLWDGDITEIVTDEGKLYWRRRKTGSPVGCSATPPVPTMTPNWLVPH